MSGGYKNIDPEVGKATQFSSTNQPENRGRPVTRPMKEMLQEIGDKMGKLSFPIDQCEILSDRVVVTVPNMQMLATVAMKKAHKGDVRWFKEIMRILGEYAPTKIEGEIKNTNEKVIITKDDLPEEEYENLLDIITEKLKQNVE